MLNNAKILSMHFFRTVLSVVYSDVRKEKNEEKKKRISENR